eukprot:COSAG05_NODE_6679_length_921_cov_1.363747_1_plen_38_part_10
MQIRVRLYLEALKATLVAATATAVQIVLVGLLLAAVSM